MTMIRTGQATAPLTRIEFRERFNGRYFDPAFDSERDAIARLEAIAWAARATTALALARCPRPGG